MEEVLKTTGPAVPNAIKIWANQTGYFDSREFYKNQTLEYNELINYWDSLPKIEVDGVPDLIFVVKMPCVRNESLVRFYSETVLKFPTLRRSFADTLLTGGHISLWPTQLRNFCLYLAQAVYLISSLAGFICLCVTCGMDVELYCFLHFIGLEMLLISGEIIQEMSIKQDVCSDVIYFDRNYLQYCPAVDAFYKFVPTSQVLLLSVLIFRRKLILESEKLQVALYLTICIILPAGYFSLSYFLPTDLRSYQCQAGLDGYPPIGDAWMSILHKNAALLVSIGVTLLTTFFTYFGSKIGIAKG
ncbi:hypothetical protein Fcan01_15938 [Folsomia candida]|uniref:Uncharacterized protein n=2 Tax=Folsomia candida TaxID=158441 RepID=A0A226DWH1_FOLCA|nr:hypothetical protein Fcan01_15938 [Folsomia candida]